MEGAGRDMQDAGESSFDRGTRTKLLVSPY